MKEVFGMQRKRQLSKPKPPKWERLTAEQANFPKCAWNNETSVNVWRYLGVPISYLLWMSEGDSEWGKIGHITIKKIDQVKVAQNPIYQFDSEEPTYAEKIRARQVVRQENKIALEIFPRSSDVVDEANLYHVWLMPEKFEFPFPIVQDLPEETEHFIWGKTFMQINYSEKYLETNWGTIRYCFLSNDSAGELKWKQKQEFKERVFGPDRVAIEVIPARATRSPYQQETCLICMPKDFRFPFGLKSTGK